MDMREHVVALNTKRIKINKEQQDFIDKRIKENPGDPFSAEDSATLAQMDADIEALGNEVHEFVKREEREQSDATLREVHASIVGTEAVLERLGPLMRVETAEVEVTQAYTDYPLLRPRAAPDLVTNFDRGSPP